MLLPSALTCDASQPSGLPRLQASLLASPPASPPTLSSQTALGSLFTTCRSLHSLIASPPTSPPMAQLPTPPLAHAPPPLKLRLRSRAVRPATTDDCHVGPRRKIVKRAPPRGLNKRRRDDDDDMGREEDEREEDADSDVDGDAQQDTDDVLAAPSTPKRARIAPEHLPLGLERSDFHGLGLSQPEAHHPHSSGTDVEVEADGAEWSAEDDRVLVELVLAKLKLSKTEWQDCARNLGRDKHSVGRRWKSLMAAGDVGLKTRGRRARLHATWR